MHLAPHAPCRYTAVSLRGFPQHATKQTYVTTPNAPPM